jgi:pyruvate dehydrogenase E1 component alpha subunit/2-oxoisovalerate dehydrogenase E1 component alpha subunit
MSGAVEAQSPPTNDGLTREDVRSIAHALLLTRRVEAVLTNLYRQDRIIGGLYRSLGQEAAAVGSAYALRRRVDGTGDILAPAVRNLGSLFVMGVRPVDVMRQYMATVDSPTRGREQNVHITDIRRGWIGLISHLGVMIEVMAGVALSFRLKSEPRVALAYIGDGGASTGAFHEGFALAAAQRLPLVVIIENNAWAYSTPVRRQTAADSFVVRARAFGVHGERCDGNDVFAVHAMTAKAVELARSGRGPALLEVVTYRRVGHAEHDGQAYVPPGELTAWEGRDPLARFEARVTAEGWLSVAELDAIRADVDAEVDRAREEAESSVLPPAEEALAEVTAGVRARAPWTRRDPVDPAEGR